MKTFFLITLFAVSLFFCFSGIQGQKVTPKSKPFPPDMIGDTLKLSHPAQQKLNQVELVKQFIGTWKCDMAKDTIIFYEIKPYGTGLEALMKYVTNGKVYYEQKRLCGYDKNFDKYIYAYLDKEENFGLIANWFISSNKLQGVEYSDISNPEKASWRFEVEFKSPDMYTTIYFENNKPVGTTTWTRIK
jgi:hypothetical protein